MNKSVFLLMVLILSLSCNQTNNPSDAKHVLKPDSSASAKKEEISQDNKVVAGDNFVFENDSLVQRLNIIFVSETDIKFKIEVNNKRSGNKSDFEGLAKRRNANADPEIDEDNEGNAYPATTYLFNDNCWLSFRIDMDSKTFARIVEANCNSRHKPDCPFDSKGTLVRLK